MTGVQTCALPIFWQGIARIFGTNLKDKYDADGEDYLIELILHEIEMGRL